jgi:hypothetical protein
MIASTVLKAAISMPTLLIPAISKTVPRVVTRITLIIASPMLLLIRVIHTTRTATFPLHKIATASQTRMITVTLETSMATTNTCHVLPAVR